MPLNPVLNGAANIATGQLTTGTAAALIVTGRKTRRAIGIYNTGSNTIYVGGQGVTTLTGHSIPAGSFVGLPTVAELWAIGAAASSLTFVEAYD